MQKPISPVSGAWSSTRDPEFYVNDAEVVTVYYRRQEDGVMFEDDCAEGIWLEIIEANAPPDLRAASAALFKARGARLFAAEDGLITFPIPVCHRPEQPVEIDVVAWQRDVGQRPGFGNEPGILEADADR